MNQVCKNQMSENSSNIEKAFREVQFDGTEPQKMGQLQLPQLFRERIYTLENTQSYCINCLFVPVFRVRC